MELTKQILPTVEDLRFTPPDFPLAELQSLLFDDFGIEGRLVQLAGERDQNVQVTTGSGSCYVLKISSAQERASAVDFQVKALEHIKQTDPGLAVPRHVRSKAGRLQTLIKSGNGLAHHVRLLTYLPGLPVAGFGPPSEALLQAVGNLIGKLCNALQDFDHPAAGDFMPWDIMNGLVVHETFIAGYLPRQHARLCAPFFDRFVSETLPRLSELPSQVIHNDMHLGNILCNPDDLTQLTGCIDFGDMVRRPTVIDIATSLGEIIGSVENPMTACRAIIAGFRQQASFPDAHLDLLYDGIFARAVLGVQLAEFRLAHANNDPDIAAKHLPNAISSLKAISSIDRKTFLQEMVKYI